MIDATRKTLFSPYDDLQTTLLNLVDSAQHKIRIADYSFNLDLLVEKLIEKHNAGLDVRLVLDKSQAAGSTERPEVLKVLNAGIPTVIGTSEKHKIMHSKFCIIDDEWVISGSYNFTNSAEAENNYFDMEHSQDRAKAFDTNWNVMWLWITNNEAQAAQEGEKTNVTE